MLACPTHCVIFYSLVTWPNDITLTRAKTNDQRLKKSSMKYSYTLGRFKIITIILFGNWSSMNFRLPGIITNSLWRLKVAFNNSTVWFLFVILSFSLENPYHMNLLLIGSLWRFYLLKIVVRVQSQNEIVISFWWHVWYKLSTVSMQYNKPTSQG